MALPGTPLIRYSVLHKTPNFIYLQLPISLLLDHAVCSMYVANIITYACRNLISLSSTVIL